MTETKARWKVIFLSKVCKYIKQNKGWCPNKRDWVCSHSNLQWRVNSIYCTAQTHLQCLTVYLCLTVTDRAGLVSLFNRFYSYIFRKQIKLFKNDVTFLCCAPLWFRFWFSCIIQNKNLAFDFEGGARARRQIILPLSEAPTSVPVR